MIAKFSGSYADTRRPSYFASVAVCLALIATCLPEPVQAEVILTEKRHARLLTLFAENCAENVAHRLEALKRHGQLSTEWSAKLAKVCNSSSIFQKLQSTEYIIEVEAAIGRLGKKKYVNAAKAAIDSHYRQHGISSLQERIVHGKVLSDDEKMTFIAEAMSRAKIEALVQLLEEIPD